MNALENWFCATGFWRIVTQHKLLPWTLSESALGEHVLELGAGPGAGTAELRRLAPRVTSVEYSHAFATGLATREPGADRSGGARRRIDAALREFQLLRGGGDPDATSPAIERVAKSGVRRNSARLETWRVLSGV
ncbi:MAG TPA: hypothetical protein VN780_03585 [Candidatus Eisenbacteria bacterium]|nr:hypothetical protein [Candidatus Eisenbacteria bacterium]